MKSGLKVGGDVHRAMGGFGVDLGMISYLSDGLFIPDDGLVDETLDEEVPPAAGDHHTDVAETHRHFHASIPGYSNMIKPAPASDSLRHSLPCRCDEVIQNVRRVDGERREKAGDGGSSFTCPLLDQPPESLTQSQVRF